MIHYITLKKKWVNPDSGKEFKKGDKLALHPSIIQDLIAGGIGESETVKIKIDKKVKIENNG